MKGKFLQIESPNKTYFMPNTRKKKKIKAYKKRVVKDLPNKNNIKHKSSSLYQTRWKSEQMAKYDKEENLRGREQLPQTPAHSGPAGGTSRTPLSCS